MSKTEDSSVDDFGSMTKTDEKKKRLSLSKSSKPEYTMKAIKRIKIKTQKPLSVVSSSDEEMETENGNQSLNNKRSISKIGQLLEKKTKINDDRDNKLNEIKKGKMDEQASSKVEDDDQDEVDDEDKISSTTDGDDDSEKDEKEENAANKINRVEITNKKISMNVQSDSDESQATDDDSAEDKANDNEAIHTEMKEQPKKGFKTIVDIIKDGAGQKAKGDTKIKQNSAYDKEMKMDASNDATTSKKPSGKYKISKENANGFVVVEKEQKRRTIVNEKGEKETQAEIFTRYQANEKKVSVPTFNHHNSKYANQLKCSPTNVLSQAPSCAKFQHERRPQIYRYLKSCLSGNIVTNVSELPVQEMYFVIQKQKQFTHRDVFYQSPCSVVVYANVFGLNVTTFKNNTRQVPVSNLSELRSDHNTDLAMAPAGFWGDDVSRIMFCTALDNCYHDFKKFILQDPTAFDQFAYNFKVNHKTAIRLAREAVNDNISGPDVTGTRDFKLQNIKVEKQIYQDPVEVKTKRSLIKTMMFKMQKKDDSIPDKKNNERIARLPFEARNAMAWDNYFPSSQLHAIMVITINGFRITQNRITVKKTLQCVSFRKIRQNADVQKMKPLLMEYDGFDESDLEEEEDQDEKSVKVSTAEIKSAEMDDDNDSVSTVDSQDMY